MDTTATVVCRGPWNKGKLFAQKAPLKELTRSSVPSQRDLRTRDLRAVVLSRPPCYRPPARSGRCRGTQLDEAPRYVRLLHPVDAWLAYAEYRRHVRPLDGHMLKIYGAPHSRAFRVVWLANEIGIPYQLIPMSFGVPDAECKKPWYLQLNPNGKLPTIDDDGFILWESAAINLYLAEKYKSHNSQLYPSTVEGRGKLLQWTFFVTNEVEPAVIAILRNRIILPLEHRNPTVADEAADKLRGLFDILENELRRSLYFAGDRWGLADFMIACVLYIVHVRLKMDFSGWPRLASWTTASVGRPAALIARQLREPL